MRTREQIEKDGARLETLILEVLLDIREQNANKEDMSCMRCGSGGEVLPPLSHKSKKIK